MKPDGTILDICFIEPTEPTVCGAYGYIGGEMIAQIENELKDEFGASVQKWIDRGYVELRCWVYRVPDQVERWPDGVPVVTAGGYWEIDVLGGITEEELRGEMG